MNAGLIVLLVTVIASLVLAVRAFRSRSLNPTRTAQMAGIWVIIIGVLAFILQRFAP